MIARETLGDDGGFEIGQLGQVFVECSPEAIRPQCLEWVDRCGR